MRTLGIDLATTDGSTGICEIDWDARRSPVQVGRWTNDVLVERICDVRAAEGWVAVDAPFGFPAAFNRSVQLWRTERRVRAETDDDLRRRLTDSYIEHPPVPRIPALRW